MNWSKAYHIVYSCFVGFSVDKSVNGSSLVVQNGCMSHSHFSSSNTVLVGCNVDLVFHAAGFVWPGRSAVLLSFLFPF